MAAQESLKTLDYNDKEVSDLLKTLSDLRLDSSYYLVLLAGENKGPKKSFLKKVKDQADGEIAEADLRDVISTVKEESYRAIDKMMESLGESKYVLLKNGDQLGGVYTGYSYSVERYATPQERYLLDKIQGTERIFLLDLDDIHTVNNTMRRHAQAMIKFEYPKSLLGRIKQIRFNGHTFSSKRKPTV